MGRCSLPSSWGDLEREETRGGAGRLGWRVSPGASMGLPWCQGVRCEGPPEPGPPGQTVVTPPSRVAPALSPLLRRGLIHMLTHVVEALHHARLLAILVIPPAVAPG